MGASDWWARKLGTQPAQQQQPTAPPTIMPGMHQAPAYPQQPPVIPQYVPPGQPQPPPGPQSVVSYNQQTGQPMADDGIMSQVMTAALATGGSQKVKEDSGTCPECGGGNYFAQRRTENGMPLRIEAAPRCFDCGYPLIQSGSAHGGASAARVDSNKVTRARQLPKNHAVTVVGEGGRMETFGIGR